MTRHETDYLSLGAGLLFAALAVWYGVTSGSGSVPDLRIVVPAILVVLGAAGMVAAVTAQRRTDKLAAPAVDDADIG